MSLRRGQARFISVGVPCLIVSLAFLTGCPGLFSPTPQQPPTNNPDDPNEPAGPGQDPNVAPTEPPVDDRPVTQPPPPPPPEDDSLNELLQDLLDQQAREQRPPTVDFVSPTTATQVGLGADFELVFRVVDPDQVVAAQPTGVNIVVARDQNADGAPDGAVLLAEPADQVGAGRLTHGFDPRLLLDQELLDANGSGQFVFGVRLLDEDLQVSTFFNPVTISVAAIPPSAVIDAPTQLTARRQSGSFDIAFTLSDPDSVLEAQPAGVRLVFALDTNADGVADGAPVFTAPQTNFAVGANTVTISAGALAPFLDANGNGRFLAGVRLTDQFGTIQTTFGANALVVDNDKPEGELFRFALPDDNPNLTNPPSTTTATWIAPADQLLTRDGLFGVWFRATDTSSYTITLNLDDDTDATNGVGPEVVSVPGAAGTLVSTTAAFDLASVAVGTYFVHVTIVDLVTADPLTFYLTAGGQNVRLRLTDRLVGSINVNDVAARGDGLTLQGVNFNDLAGASVTGVPDLDNDGADELVVVSRFGKPFIINDQGVGFGEAYTIYGGQGTSGRLTGEVSLNSVGGNLQGLTMPGIRFKINEIWSRGISDVAVIPDMDGDERAELVFSFPRTESISLDDPAFSNGFAYQHPDLVSDQTNLGLLEFSVVSWLNQQTRLGNIDPNDPNDPFANVSWVTSLSQFTRGGIVIVSSQNELLLNRTLFDRKGARVIDLHEVGQLFSLMEYARLRRYVRDVTDVEVNLCFDCDSTAMGDCGGLAMNPDEKEVSWRVILNDMYFADQGPGGFSTFWSEDILFGGQEAIFPPLANEREFGSSLFPGEWNVASRTDVLACDDDDCIVHDAWFPWSVSEGFGAVPGTSVTSLAPSLSFDPNIAETPPDNVGSWFVPNAEAGVPSAPFEGAYIAYTGFYPVIARPFVTTDTGALFPAPVGARVLGQDVDDSFGNSVAADNRWLFMAAPDRTASAADVPALLNAGGNRTNSGVVYMYRVDTRQTASSPTRSQLWIEPDFLAPTDPNDPNTAVFAGWPNPDVHISTRVDFTMPVPHQYVIESIGSHRGRTSLNDVDPNSITAPTGYHTFNVGATDCTAAFNSNDIWHAEIYEFQVPYNTGTAAYNMGTTPQIVGPHANARISFVETVGDMNGDGIGDFVVGSPDILSNVVNGTGDTVGGLFIVFGRTTGLEGDYLLERLALAPSAANRLRGVLLRGESANARLARSIDAVGRFNGDAFDDVVVGSENGSGGRGEAIVIFGSSTLLSPEGGFTTSSIVTAGRAVRFIGEEVGDQAGANVAGVGDMDGDGFSEILIAAPGADSGAGKVYLIYGSSTLTGDLDLALVGTVDLPGAVFSGRNPGDALGGGTKSFTGTNPGDPSEQFTAFSRGVAGIGDFDGDGAADIAMSAVLADPGDGVNNIIDAGEVYIIYGRRTGGAP